MNTVYLRFLLFISKHTRRVSILHALVKLGETLGRPDDSMWRDGAKLATPPEDKRD